MHSQVVCRDCFFFFFFFFTEEIETEVKDRLGGRWGTMFNRFFLFFFFNIHLHKSKFQEKCLNTDFMLHYIGFLTGLKSKRGAFYKFIRQGGLNGLKRGSRLQNRSWKPCCFSVLGSQYLRETNKMSSFPETTLPHWRGGQTARKLQPMRPFFFFPSVNKQTYNVASCWS